MKGRKPLMERKGKKIRKKIMTKVEKDMRKVGPRK